jgi:hypothetical protein
VSDAAWALLALLLPAARPGQGRDTEQKPLNTGFEPTTTVAEVISGVSLEGNVAIASRRSERV